MKTTLLRRALLPSLLVAFAACDTESSTAPEFEEVALTADDQLVLAVLTDADAIEAGIALAEVAVLVTEEAGGPFAVSGRSPLNAARLRFAAARSAREAGADREALSQAEEARMMLAEALEDAGGAAAVIGAVERAEALALEVAADPGSYIDADLLTTQLNELSSRARNRLQQGDRRGAVRDAVAAEQARELRRRGTTDLERVELALALGQTAIDLAGRLLPDAPLPEQLRFLRSAERHLRSAVTLAEQGHPNRAIHQAELAVWSALKAVVAPGGVSEEEQRMVLDLATELLAEARAAGAQEANPSLLELAARFLSVGEEQLEAGNVRGVATLWSSAVISSWLIA